MKKRFTTILEILSLIETQTFKLEREFYKIIPLKVCFTLDYYVTREYMSIDPK